MRETRDRPGSGEGLVTQRFRVPFEYPVYFTRAAFDPANRAFAETVGRLEPARRHRVFIVVDAGVDDAWPDLNDAITTYFDRHAARLALVAPPLIVPGGEAVKNDRRAVETVLDALARRRLDRHAVVAVVGGGAVQDAAGYAAAIAHRGIRVVRVPTTVLAQCDGGVGVKNGINGYGAKNFLGTFAPPFAVVDDFDFLATLAPRDRIAGLSEAVKVALVRDAAFFDVLEAEAQALARFDADATARAVRRCAELHLEHIATSGDPFEQGAARPLDFGHWSAHKLEMTTGHRLNHGEAVAIGMALDARYAHEAGLLAAEDVERICALLEGLGFVLWDDALGRRDGSRGLEILAGIEEFREHLGGELTITLLRGIGRPVDVHAMDLEAVARAVEWLERRAAARAPTRAVLGR